MEVFGVAILVLGLVGANLLRRHLREAKQLRLREIIHEERMQAMEHSAPLPGVDDAALIGQLIEGIGDSPGNDSRGLTMAVLWVRIVALCVGLASFFGGIATCVGMFLVNDPEFSNYWAMGLIPTLIGLGLLIFFVMSRSLVGQTAERGLD
jgi:hypothetical protein